MLGYCFLNIDLQNAFADRVYSEQPRSVAVDSDPEDPRANNGYDWSGELFAEQTGRRRGMD
jgi:hypothetical protein